MNNSQPRLRMFSGPNGSGKSTLKTVLPAELLGIYLNPDEIEIQIRSTGVLAVADYGVIGDLNLDGFILQFFQRSNFLKSVGLDSAMTNLKVVNGTVDFSGIEINSYHASVATDCLRQLLLKQKASFTFETVMSSSEKVKLLETAQSLGYRTYLYYVATKDPAINISRVQHRVATGGHAVPEDKIIDRYFRSLDLLMDAIRKTNRAYIFDNSGHNLGPIWLAEITDGHSLEVKSTEMPSWFEDAYLKKKHQIDIRS